MKKIINVHYIFLFLVLISSNSFAQEQRDWKVSVGYGMIFKKNLRVENRYEDMDKSVHIKSIPFLQGNYGRFSLGPQGIAVRAVGDFLKNVSVFIKRDGDRYQGLAMIPRKDSAFVGATARFYSYGFSISKDINGRSKGIITQLSYGKMFPLSETFMLRAGASLDWNDDKYAEYYYSVRATEATASRREYHLNNYFQPGVNVMPIYKLNEDVSVTTILGMKLIPKEVRQSPTMNGDKLDYSGIIGVSYNL